MDGQTAECGRKSATALCWLSGMVPMSRARDQFNATRENKMGESLERREN